MAIGPFAQLGYGVCGCSVFLGFYVIFPLLGVISIWQPLQLHLFGLILTYTIVVSFLWALLCGCLDVDVYRTPPFCYFWRRWTIRFPRRGYHRSSDKGINFADSCMTNKLCERCLQLVRESGLLVGSKWLLTRSLEWHNSHISLRELQISSQEFCHLCTIFWCSIPESRRQATEEADARLEEELHALEINHLGSYDFSPIEVQDRIFQSMRLRVRVWEEPSGHWHDEQAQYMQLYRGEDSLCKELRIEEGSTHVCH